MALAKTVSTIPATATQAAAKSPNVMNDFFTKLQPYLPYILIAVIAVVLIFLAYQLYKKFGGGRIRKDYDEAAFKEKAAFLARDPARIPSWSMLFLAVVLLLSVVVSATVVIALWLFSIIKKPEFTAALWIDVAILILAFVITRKFHNKFNSYPEMFTTTGEFIGYVLSRPKLTPDGCKEILIFKGWKWLLLKETEIVVIPVRDKVSYPRIDGKGKATYVCKLPEELRWWFMGNGDIMINAPDIFKTKYYVYPVFEKGAHFDFKEFAFLREKAEGDFLSLSDLSNSARENALTLVGSNPAVRMDNATSGDRESENG